MRVRLIDPLSSAEIALVANRMLETLVEVEGTERGLQIHSIEWLEQRVRWHLDAAAVTGQVLVAEDAGGDIVGHLICRLDNRGAVPTGLIATAYVLPAFRRSGIARDLVDRAHHWFRAQGAALTSTWTSGTNSRLISLFEKFGYQIVDNGPNGVNGTPMVKLGAYLDHVPIRAT